MANASRFMLARFALASSVVFVVPAAHAQHDEVISDCLSTYINRGCHSWCIGQPVERDADVFYVGENRWLSDAGLGGHASGKNVPQGRYFYVHNVINAIVRSCGRNHRSVEQRCIMDFRTDQRKRDYFHRSYDEAFYDYYKRTRMVDLKGIDHCVVTMGDHVRTITLEQMLRQMQQDSYGGQPGFSPGSTAPDRQPTGSSWCWATATGVYGYG